MDKELRQCLELCETDVDGALNRFAGDEAFYVECLGAFLEDPTMRALNEAIASQEWDDAFTAAHALKGLAGNMGFVPLFYATSELVMRIRAGKIGEIDATNKSVNKLHDSISEQIRKYCAKDL